MGHRFPLVNRQIKRPAHPVKRVLSTSSTVDCRVVPIVVVPRFRPLPEEDEGIRFVSRHVADMRPACIIFRQMHEGALDARRRTREGGGRDRVRSLPDRFARTTQQTGSFRRRSYVEGAVGGLREDSRGSPTRRLRPIGSPGDRGRRRRLSMAGRRRRGVFGHSGWGMWRTVRVDRAHTERAHVTAARRRAESHSETTTVARMNRKMTEM
jgi:hypothetical protein